MRKGGDREAFAALATATYGRLHRLAQNILSDTDRADDAAQQAVVDIWRKLPQLREASRFEAWSYRILVNRCYAEARRSRGWLRVFDASAELRGNEFVGNRHAVTLGETDATLADNTIRGGEIGVMVTAGSSPLIRENLVENVATRGIFVANGTSPTIEGNTLYGSASNLYVGPNANPALGANDICPDEEAAAE